MVQRKVQILFHPSFEEKVILEIHQTGNDMKKNWKKVNNILLGSFMAALGFEACDNGNDNGNDNGDVDIAMYGVPVTRFQIVGSVTNESGQPLEGIKARVGFKTDYVVGDQHFDYCAIDSAVTDAKGELKMESGEYDPYVSMVLTDEDGEQNGGEYLTDTLNLNDMKKEQAEKGKGSYKLTFTHQMKKK